MNGQSAFMQLWGEIPLSTVVLIVVAVIFIITLGKKIYKSITFFHDKINNREEEFINLQKEIKILKEQQILNTQHIQTVAEKQQKIIQQVQDNRLEIQQREMNSIRNQLVKTHRYYANKHTNPTMEWTELEANAFNALYDDYIKVGGNGYIQNNVKPDLDKLNIIPMNDHLKIEQLQKTRKQGGE